MFDGFVRKVREKRARQHRCDLLMDLLRQAGKLPKDANARRQEIEDQVGALIDDGVEVDARAADAVLQTWPGLAQVVLATGAMPSSFGWQALIKRADEHRARNCRIQAVLSAFPGRKIGGIPWAWTEVCEQLIVAHPTSEAWNAVFGSAADLGTRKRRLIGWLGEADESLLELLEKQREQAGLPGKLPITIPKSQSGRTALLYRTIAGFRGDLEEKLSATERMSWIEDLLAAGARPNGGGDETENGMAFAIKASDHDVVGLLLDHGGRVEWSDLQPAIASRIKHHSMMQAYAPQENRFFGDDDDRDWFCRLMGCLPVDFDWDRKVFVEYWHLGSPAHGKEVDLLPFIEAHLPFITAQQQWAGLDKTTAATASPSRRAARL